MYAFIDHHDHQTRKKKKTSFLSICSSRHLTHFPTPGTPERRITMHRPNNEKHEKRKKPKNKNSISAWYVSKEIPCRLRKRQHIDSRLPPKQQLGLLQVEMVCQIAVLAFIRIYSGICQTNPGLLQCSHKTVLNGNAGAKALLTTPG